VVGYGNYLLIVGCGGLGVPSMTTNEIVGFSETNNNETNNNEKDVIKMGRSNGCLREVSHGAPTQVAFVIGYREAQKARLSKVTVLAAWKHVSHQCYA
jgi:hypothetical protein